MKTRTRIQGMTYDIYPSGYDLTLEGKVLNFSNISSQMCSIENSAIQNNTQFVEQLLLYNPSIGNQLCSNTHSHEQPQVIQQLFESGELIVVQPDSEPDVSVKKTSPWLSASSITSNDINTNKIKQAQATLQSANIYSSKGPLEAKAEGQGEHEATVVELNYQLTVEVAGGNHSSGQSLQLSKTDKEHSQTQSPTNDNKQRHRSLVSFQEISQNARKMGMAISMNTEPSPMLLPLLNATKPFKNSATKSEWDNVIIPIKPMRYLSEKNIRNEADLPNNGWLYLFWKGKLWRELEVAKNAVLRDSRVEWYRNQIRCGLHKSNDPRKAEGHWLSDVWVPYKLDNEYQLGQSGLRIAFSEEQWPWALIQTLEENANSLIAKTSSLDAIQQYSTQQNFESSEGNINTLETALSALKKNKLTSAQSTKIAAIYLPTEVNEVQLKISDTNLEALVGKRYQLITGYNTTEGVLPFDGVIKSAVAQHITEGELLVWCNSHTKTPSHKVKVQFGKLDTLITVTGLQARLNNLNHNAGNVDGITGRKTLLAIKQFQQRHNLIVDGDAGPITKKKIKAVHGS